MARVKKHLNNYQITCYTNNEKKRKNIKNVHLKNHAK